MVANHIELPRPSYTLEEYFALLEASDKRWEFWDGELVCMAGSSPHHSIITSQTVAALNRQLAGRGCLVFGGDTAIKTPSLPPFRYPDVSVVCGKPAFVKVDKFYTLANPLVVIEILSPGTEYLDQEPKRVAYQALPSVQEYLLIAQTAPHVTRYARKGRRWQLFDYDNLRAVAELSSLQCTLPLQEVYAGIEFN